MKPQIAVIQLQSGLSITSNLLQVQEHLIRASEQGADLVILPDYFALMPHTLEAEQSAPEPLLTGRIQQFLSQIAKQLGLWIVASGIFLKLEDDQVACSAFCYDASGHQRLRYDRQRQFLHPRGRENQLSLTACQGPSVIDTPWGKLGVLISEDLYFPEAFQSLRNLGAELIALCAAVPHYEHWKILVRARAIETQCYLLAANQIGFSEATQGPLCCGHSQIVDPWGQILAQQQVGVGLDKAKIDFIRLEILREEFPLKPMEVK